MTDIQKIRRFKVVSNRVESPRIFTLTLEPENIADALTFKPGQFVFLHLFNEDGTTWKAPFSLANAPEQGSDGRLELTIKIHKDFTTRASKLFIGDSVGIQGPYGMFVPDEKATTQIIFASGVGITPFMSMVRFWKNLENPPRVIIFYSVRERENFVFIDELERISREKFWLHPVFIATGEVLEDWKGERGRMDVEMFKRHAVDPESASFMACGKAEFVETVKKILENQNIDLKTRFKAEMFG